MIFKTYYVLIIALLTFVSGFAYAQISIEPVVTEDKEQLPSDTISETDNRKSFGYCPISSDTTIILDKYGVTYSITSCPLSRIYVDNWDKLDITTQEAIVNEFASKQYFMEKE